MRVAVCAPSNKAVQEILSRFEAKHPDFPILLIGNTRRGLTPQLQKVHVDSICSTFADLLTKAVAKVDIAEVKKLCSSLKRWNLELPFAPVLQQCARSKTKRTCYFYFVFQGHFFLQSAKSFVGCVENRLALASLTIGARTARQCLV